METNGKCTFCNAPAYISFNAIECTNSYCKCYKEEEGPEAYPNNNPNWSNEYIQHVYNTFNYFSLSSYMDASKLEWPVTNPVNNIVYYHKPPVWRLKDKAFRLLQEAWKCESTAEFWGLTAKKTIDSLELYFNHSGYDVERSWIMLPK